jgi:hypothetical protein
MAFVIFIPEGYIICRRRKSAYFTTPPLQDNGGERGFLTAISFIPILRSVDFFS